MRRFTRITTVTFNRRSEAILERDICTTVTRLVVLCTRCPRDAQGSRLCQDQRKESSDLAKWHFDLFLTENEKKMTSDVVLRWPGDKSTLMLSRVWRHKRRFPENLPGISQCRGVPVEVSQPRYMSLAHTPLCHNQTLSPPRSHPRSRPLI